MTKKKIADAQQVADLGPIIEVSETTTIPANSNQGLLATCPEGTRVISGGGFPPFNSSSLVVDKAQGNGWRVDYRNDANMEGTMKAFAYCLAR